MSNNDSDFGSPNDKTLHDSHELLGQLDESKLTLYELVDSIVDDQRKRFADQELPNAETYFERFPRLLTNDDSIIDIIYNEFLLRHSDSPTEKNIESYLARFPKFKTKLSKQLKFYLGLNSASDLIEPARRTTPNDVPEIESKLANHDNLIADDLIAGRFEILKELGGGGFATVYEAHDHILNRRIALKIAHSSVAKGSDVYQRFVREAESAARLNHPNIVQFYEFGVHNHRPFIVQQLIESGSLLDQVENSSPSERESAEWIWQVCLALEYAHQLGVIHRDIKPANVLLDKNKRAQIADFGLASLAGSNQNITQHGDMLGTPAYMSPEQVRGNEAIDAQSDVYSAGAVLYHLICQTPPFEGNTSSVLQQVMNTEPIAPRQINKNISVDLETICLKALSKERHARYAGAVEFGADLFRYLNNEPIKARRVSTYEKVVRWCLRNPALATTISIASAVLLTVCIIAFNRITDERDRYRAQRDVANSNLLESLLNNAETNIRSKPNGWYDKAIDSLNQAATFNTENQNKNRLRELMIELLGSTTPRFHLESTLHKSNKVDPSGSVIAISHESKNGLFAASWSDGSVKVVAADFDSTCAELVGPKHVVSKIEILPSAQWVFGLSDDQLWYWELGTPILKEKSAENEPRTIQGQLFDHQKINSFALSDCGRSVAIASLDFKIQVFDISKQGKPMRVANINTHHSAVKALEFSASSNEIINAGFEDRRIHQWSIDNGVLTNTVNHVYSSIHALGAREDELCWTDRVSFQINHWNTMFGNSPSENLSGQVFDVEFIETGTMIYGCSDGTLGLASLNNGINNVAQVSGFGEITSLSVNETDQSVLCGYADGRIRKWMIQSSKIVWSNTTLRHPLAVDADNCFELAKCRLRIEGDLECDLIGYDQHAIRRMVANPANNQIACLTSMGIIVVDPANQSIQARIDREQAPPRAIHIKPDGSQIAYGDQNGEIHLVASSDLSSITQFQIPKSRLFEIKMSNRFLCAIGSLGIAVWDLKSRQSVFQYTHNQNDGCIAIHQDLLAFQDDEDHIRLIRLGEQPEVLARIPHDQSIGQIEFHDDGNQLITLEKELATIRVWDLQSQSEKMKFTVAPNANQFSLDPKGEWIISFASNFVARDAGRIFDLKNGNQIAQIGGSSGIFDIRFSKDGSQIWTGSSGIQTYQRSKIAEAVQRNQTSNIPVLIPVSLDDLLVTGHLNDSWSAVVLPDGDHVVTTGHDQNIIVRNKRSGKVTNVLQDHAAEVWSCACSADGSYLATGSQLGKQGEVIVWSTENWKLERRLLISSDLISGLSFHPRLPVLAVSSFDGSAYLVNWKTGETIQRLLPTGTPAMDIRFAENGHYLVAARTGSGATIWKCGETIDSIIADQTDLLDPAERIWAVQFTEDGKTLVAGTESGLLRFYSLENLKLIVTLKTTAKSIRKIEFSNDGRYLAFTAYPLGGQVWDMEKLREHLQTSKLDW